MTLLALALALAVQDAAPPRPVSTPIGQFTRTVSDQPIELPDDIVVIQGATVVIPAGGVVPEHFHPEQRIVYVLSGRLRIDNLETGTSAEYGEGAMIIEPRGQWHRGTALDDQPVRLLVIDQMSGAGSNMVMR